MRGTDSRAIPVDVLDVPCYCLGCIQGRIRCWECTRWTSQARPHRLRWLLHGEPNRRPLHPARSCSTACVRHCAAATIAGGRNKLTGIWMMLHESARRVREFLCRQERSVSPVSYRPYDHCWQKARHEQEHPLVCSNLYGNTSRTHLCRLLNTKAWSRRGLARGAVWRHLGSKRRVPASGRSS